MSKEYESSTQDMSRLKGLSRKGVTVDRYSLNNGSSRLLFKFIMRFLKTLERKAASMLSLYVFYESVV